jgi:hypothetical protein
MLYLKTILFFLTTALSLECRPKTTTVAACVAPSPAPQQKPLSRKKLRQELGAATKNLLGATADFVDRSGKFLVAAPALVKSEGLLKKTTSEPPLVAQKSLGSMLQQVAYLQKVCASLAEALLDDEPRIAKAKKIDLQASLQTLHEAILVCEKDSADLLVKITAERQTRMAAQDVELQRIIDRVKKDPCLRLT